MSNQDTSSPAYMYARRMEKEIADKLIHDIDMINQAIVTIKPINHLLADALFAYCMDKQGK